MKILKGISRVLNTVLGYITFAAFFVIMAFIVVNVVMRYIFNSPVLGAYEIVEQMMFVGVFCSFAYAQQEGAHIRVNMLISHLPRRLAMVICALTSLAATAVLALLTYAAYKQDMSAITYAYSTAQLKISLVPFYTLEVVCSAIFAFAVALNAVEYIIGIFNEELAKELIRKF